MIIDDPMLLSHCEVGQINFDHVTHKNDLVQQDQTDQTITSSIFSDSLSDCNS
jgi:hypothetical protein